MGPLVTLPQGHACVLWVISAPPALSPVLRDIQVRAVDMSVSVEMRQPVTQKMAGVCVHLVTMETDANLVSVLFYIRLLTFVKMNCIKKCWVYIISCHIAHFKQNVMKTVLARTAVEIATVLKMVAVTRWQVNVTVTLAGWGTGAISCVHRESLGRPVSTLVFVRTMGHVTQWADVAAACQGSMDRAVNSVRHIATIKPYLWGLINCCFGLYIL